MLSSIVYMTLSDYGIVTSTSSEMSRSPLFFGGCNYFCQFCLSDSQPNFHLSVYRTTGLAWSLSPILKPSARCIDNFLCYSKGGGHVGCSILVQEHYCKTTLAKGTMKRQETQPSVQMPVTQRFRPGWSEFIYTRFSLPFLADNSYQPVS